MQSSEILLQIYQIFICYLGAFTVRFCSNIQIVPGNLA